MKHLVSKEGFLFVNKDFINGVIVAKELFIPDDHNLDLYMELPEQEVLELQEKYNIGDYTGRTSKLSCSQRTGFAGGNRTRK